MVRSNYLSLSASLSVYLSAKRHLNVKNSSKPSFLPLFTCKCSSGHNGMHFFDIWMPKSGPNAWWFCRFWLGHVLRPAMACTFSTSQLVKVLGGRQCLTLVTSCYFRRCFAPQRRARKISHLASWLPTRRFSKPTFRLSWATNPWKNVVFRDFDTFWCTCISCLLTFSHFLFFDFLTFELSLYSHFLFWLSALLFICPYCRKLSSKLPSINNIYLYPPVLRGSAWGKSLAFGTSFCAKTSPESTFQVSQNHNQTL